MIALIRLFFFIAAINTQHAIMMKYETYWSRLCFKNRDIDSMEWNAVLAFRPERQQSAHLVLGSLAQKAVAKSMRQSVLQ